MTDSKVLKTIQDQFESQTLSLHQTLQQYMATVDSRLDDLRSQIHGSSTTSGRALHQPNPISHSPEVIAPVLRSMKMEVPKFDGSDPNGWVFQIEEFFDFHGTSEPLRSWIVSFHMEGRTAAWYQWMKMNSLLTTWKEFLQNLKHRFGASLYDDPQGNLSKLTQTTTMAKFQTAFEDLMNRVTGISEPLLISFFIPGLKPYIRRELLFARPSSFMEAFALARAYEAHAEEAKQGPCFVPKWNHTSLTPHTHSSSPKFPPNPYQLTSAQPVHSTSVAHTPTPSQTNPSLSKPNLLPPLLPTPNLSIHRLTPAELRDKREKGLCYNCDKKYNTNHRCRSKFLLLMGTDDVEPDFCEELLSSDSVEEVVIGDISSLNALAGQINPHSLCLVREVSSQSFQVLIDSGSTHNFIKPALAERLGLSIQPTVKFRVYIGNGDFLMCKYFCPHVALTMQGTVFTVDLFVLPIEGPDIVLGIQWLQLLRRVYHDYSALSMDFCWHGAPVTLRGDLSTTSSLITLNQLQALVHNAGISHLFALQPVHVLREESTHTPGGSPFELPVNLTKPFVTLLHTYRNLFLPPTALPPHRTIDHKIHLLPNTTPVNVRQYRYPHFQKNEMEKLIREMLEQGIIRPSQSPFSSPVLLVKKNDGTYRFCVDYKALNAVAIKDKFPISTIDELFDELGGAAIFTKLDLQAGYHQIRVHHRDIYKTVFHTHEGHYEFLVMSFGLTNAPSTFQATMNQIFASFLRKFVIVFFYDILVYSAIVEEHFRHLEQLLWCLQFHQFFVKLSKCLFCQELIDYLGHIVSASDVRADPKKIKAMVRWPPPQTTKQLRGFLGLTGYYRRFIRGYASLVAPLTDLLCKDAFKSTQATTEAFEALKRAMVKAPMLRLPNFDSKFILETDASNVGIGAMLMQYGHPICYFSKKLGPRLRASSTYLKELTVIVEAVYKWRQYLLSCTNLATDALSRVHEEASVEPSTRPASCLPLLSHPSFELLATLHSENSTLPDIIDLHHQLATGSLSSDYSVQNGFFLYRHRYYISPSSSLKTVLLAKFHSTPLAGHAGIKCTLVRLASTFFWPKMRSDVERFVAECLVCQQTKYSTQAPTGPLQPLPIPTLVWDELTMDFITCLPVSRGFTVILVVVDRLTKSAHFRSLPTQFPAVKTADLFVDMVIKLYGFPSSIIFDRDPALFGRPPPSIPPYSKGSTSIQALDEALSERDALLRSLKKNLRQAQHRMIQKVNAHRRKAQFAIGDQVLVKLQPYRQSTVATRSCQKLAKRYYGPFSVLARVGLVAYKLALPSGSKIHLVFHISLLKRFHGSQTLAPHILPSISVDNQPLYRPAAICAVRTVLKQGVKCRQILVSFEAGGNDTTFQIQLNQPEYLQEEQPNDESDYCSPRRKPCHMLRREQSIMNHRKAHV
ncbi:uncharacterized protein LOC112498643 [Citrus sinensis]|uniref:uncharacterized protein LOC112498643 n=1 Tax=Citrus sinensis TaxID=2711 RepID=UPI000D630FD5|nr:uncharacterized protein LOC112498643 [Citrus sinensis]